MVVCVGYLDAMTYAQQITAKRLEANYGRILGFAPTNGRFDKRRIVVQYAKGASVIVNSNGTYIG